MSNVYEVIDKLREASHWSWRGLAVLAKISPSTLATLIKRKPDKINVGTLTKLAGVFGVEWYELLTLNSNTSLRDMAPSERVYVEVQDFEFQDIIDHALHHPGHIRFSNGFGDPITTPSPTPQYAPQPTSDEQLFRQTIGFILDKLNTTGLREAMRRLLDIAYDPQYTNQKEETLCQEDEPRTAQDYNPESAQTDDGNAVTKSE